MSIICPTVLARDAHDYQTQLNRVAPFAKRVQIDLTDGIFAPTPTVALEQVWYPEGLQVDLHLMYKEPIRFIDEAILLKPNMVILHAEADGTFHVMAEKLHKNGIKAGVALLPKTSTHVIKPAMALIDHVLIFSGSLGKFGGTADPSLLKKIPQLKEWNPDVEIGWDGGINDTNVIELMNGGVDVLNVGGYIQNAPKPQERYAKLDELIHKRDII